MTYWRLCSIVSVKIQLFFADGRGRPGCPGHLVLKIHQLRQFQTRTIILPYERREYTFCLGGVTIDMERGILEVRGLLILYCATVHSNLDSTDKCVETAVRC